MEPGVTTDCHEHVVNITRNNVASLPFHYDDDNDDSDELRYAVGPSTSAQQPMSQSSSSTSPSASNSGNASFTRRGESYGRSRQRNPLNSGLWISIELVVNISQIIAAAVVLSLSRHEHPQSPLFAWIIGYTVGCIATLPHLYWRYIHRNNQSSEHAPEHASSQLNLPEPISYTNVIYPQTVGGDGRSSSTSVIQSRWNSVFFGTRFDTLVDHFKMALDCFFAVWFVVGTVWIFGGHSSAYTAPNLYRLCIVFLTFSCIGYAMPFVLCATICCCLPCIISLLGSRENLRPARGATTDAINSLPTYKFKSRRNQNRGDNASSSGHLGEGGIVAAGTKKERIISAEDAVCCICLSTYLDNDALRELPCSHFFHMECVDKWLKVNALCPLCKVGLGDTSPSFFSYFGRLLSIRRLGSATDASRAVL